MSLSLSRSAPFTCLEKTVVLSPKLASPPAGKFEEPQRSAVVPDIFQVIKPESL